MISVVIPSYKDPLLHKTIDSLLENARGDIEIIAVLDGYWTTIKDDPRITTVHIGKNGGMREAINAGVRIAKGEYIMRVDEHIMFAKGFDEEILKTFDGHDDYIVTARRYYLDPVKWEVMKDEGFVDYERLVLQSTKTGRKFTGLPSPKPEGYGDIYESQAMQGSCWVMKKSWWNKVIKRLESEGYGTHLQDSHEMVFKTWQAGGKLMVNSRTWFAHKHVSFARTHALPNQDKELQWTYDHWQEYYREVKKKWQS